MSSLITGENFNMQQTNRDPAREISREVGPRDPVQTLSVRRPRKKRKGRKPGFGKISSPSLSKIRNVNPAFAGTYRWALGRRSPDRSVAPKKSKNINSNPFLAKKGKSVKRNSRTDPESDKFLGSCQIGTWNANSISKPKFEYATRNLIGNTNSSDGFLAITELSKTDTNLVNFVNSHPDYPIFSDPKNYRVGLMTSKFLAPYVKIVDVWQYNMEKRKVKSNTACQMTTYGVKVNKVNITIAVVYLVPDADVAAVTAVYRKLIELEKSYENLIALGDYNLDFRSDSVQKQIAELLGDRLRQVVDKTTRKSKRTTDGQTTTSETIIDLVFLSDGMFDLMVKKPKIIKDTPSDHYLVRTEFNIDIPKTYMIKEYYLDPTRRPPIKPDKLQTCLDELKEIFCANQDLLNGSSQSEILEFIRWQTREVLDKHNPLNKKGLHKKKIYRIPLSNLSRELIKSFHSAKISLHKAERNKMPPPVLMERRQAFKAARRAKKQQVRRDTRKYRRGKLEAEVNGDCGAWDIIKRCFPEKRPPLPTTPLEIRGKQGDELADHMANYFYNRARLVSDEDIAKHSDYVPLPQTDFNGLPPIDFDPVVDLDVAKLFDRKSRPTLATGPDTLSHRHVMDLMPVLQAPLKMALEKPFDKLPDVTRNFNRLISKEKNPKLPLDEKTQRPIGELDILPKYGPINIFMGQFRDKMMTRLKSNQYALPGRGGPMAVFVTLDDVAVQCALGLKVYLVFWDFSNAFCTTHHDVTMDIADAYNISPQVRDFLLQFLDQSCSTIKMSDVNGYYLSSELKTGRGGCQGQIGVDLLFAMVNDSIDPISTPDVPNKRRKYVDDFTDVMAAKFAQLLAESLSKNEVLMKKMATATGLKLNDGKTKILPINLVEHERPSDPPGTPENEKRVVDSWTMLGFPFKVVRTADNLGPLGSGKKTKESVTGDPAAVAMIGRLNESVRVMNTIRKVSTSLERRVDNACNLVYKCCYDIGLVYCYASPSYFKDIEICIKKVLKSAGLDWMTDSDILYQITLKISPKFMAIKQIIQLGIKEIDPEKVKLHRYLIRARTHDEFRPFWSKFRQEFNNLPLKTRKYIVDILDPLDKPSMENIKARLKTHFRAKFDPAPPSKEKRSALILKHKYSKSVVIHRKRKAKADKFEKDHNTPVAKRFRLNCPEIFKKMARINTLAPPCPVRLRKPPLKITVINLPTIDSNTSRVLYEPINRLIRNPEPTVSMFPPVAARVQTPVRKPFKSKNLRITISNKRPFDFASTEPISISETPDMGKNDGKKTQKEKPVNPTKKGRKTSKNVTQTTTACSPAALAVSQFQATSAKDTAEIIFALGRSASACPETSEINKKYQRKTVLIIVHEDTRKAITPEFWNGLKQNPFKQEMILSMMQFTDKLPSVESINLAAAKDDVVGVVLIPMFMKSLDYVDPDGTLAEINLPNRKKRKVGFGQGTLANQPEMEMDTSPGTSTSTENTTFNAELPEKDVEEIKAVFEHVAAKTVEMSTWIMNFKVKFPSCNSIVMISDVETNSVEPASSIIQSAVLERIQQNINIDYFNFVFSNPELVALGIAKNIDVSQVMVKYDAQKYQKKSTEEQCKAFVELQVFRGCKELSQRLKTAKNDKKKAQTLFTAEGACGDPFGDSM